MNTTIEAIATDPTDDPNYDPTDPKNTLTDQELNDLTKNHKWTQKNTKSRRGILRALSNVHKEIEAKYPYVEKSGTDYAQLFLDTLSMPIDTTINIGTQDAELE